MTMFYLWIDLYIKMNIVEFFIKSYLDYHKLRYNLIISDEQTLGIIKSVINSGVYSFQLIYNENRQVILVKDLDWTKVVSTLDCWSYDGGRQFKYSSIETLKLDIQKIRELKLNLLF